MRRLSKVFSGIVALVMAMSCFVGVGMAESSEHPNWVADEPVKITLMTSEGSSQALPLDSISRQETKEKTNVELIIQSAPAGSYSEKMNITLGTNNFADIIYLEGAISTVANYVSDEIFLDISPYINETDMPNFYKVWQENPELSKYMIDGHLYCLPVLRVGETANGFGAVIRMDLLEKNGIATPTTFEELLTALTKLKEIYPDSVPWIGRKGTMQLLATASYMLGSGFGSRPNPMYWDADKGEYRFGPAHEEFTAVLDYLNRAYMAGVLDPEYSYQAQETMEANMQSGKSFFMLDNSGFGQNYQKILVQVEGQEDAKLQVLPTLENSFGDRRAVSYARVFSGRLYAINASAKNIPSIIKYVDWLYSDEGFAVSNYGKEGVTFEYDEENEPRYIQSYVEQFKGAEPSSYYALYSDLGTGLLDFTLLACNTRTQFEIQRALGEFTPDVEEYWEIIANDDAYVEPHLEPSFTVEESDRIKELLTDINTYVDQEYDNFIIGVKSVDDWATIIKNMENMGVRELEQIYNTAEGRSAAQ